MTSSQGDEWIVFNGEIFNYRELRDELAGRGHAFRSGTDTEVILAAWREWGEACLSRFNGMWAFAIWCPTQRMLFLARDRFGVKPLFYAEAVSGFSFASEIKALVGDQGLPFVPSDASIFRYLASDVLPSPSVGDTFFENVRSLPPGSWLKVTPGRVVIHRWYSLPAANNPTVVDPRTAAEEYRALFTDAVSLRLRADVPIGTCLSGGLDSSSIVGVMRRVLGSSGDIRTFSAVYDEAGPFNEREYIEAVLQASQASPTFTVPSVERLRADATQLVWHQEEPFGSTSIFAQWCVMASVKEQGVTVLLDGQGADEALAGYRPFDVHLSDLLRRGAGRQALAELRAQRAVSSTSPLRTIARTLAWQLPERASRNFRRRRQARASHGLLPTLVRGHSAMEPRVPRRRNLQAHLEELVTELSLPHLLRFEDRNSMAFSVEARVPFLDHRLMEYSFGRGAPWRIRGGWTKWILREAMRDTVPERIVWRRDKVGFETPERRWLRLWLEHETDLFHRDSRSAKYLDLNVVHDAVRRWTLHGDGDGRRVWRWINLELWLRAWDG